MRISIRQRTVGLLILMHLPGLIYAHKPIYAEEEPDTWQNALHIDEPQVSQVYYSELNPTRPHTWLVLDAQQGDTVYFSMGVPQLPRLQVFRPTIAILGPELAQADLGFAVPRSGPRVFPSSSILEYFHEPVTNTDSWILVQQEFTIPADGTYYLVAYSDQYLPEAAKLWVSIGTVERFGLADLFSLCATVKKVRQFHEVD